MKELQDVGSCKLTHDHGVAGSFDAFPESCVANGKMVGGIWNRTGDLEPGKWKSVPGAGLVYV